ncbi:MAG: phosphate/phosphite/phosphonate ABC transporter substrate-binding protein [Deltaproteobacteria bacterium]|nr:phosphate/phosphite/phosphonate ABC transporter substrate-binding protein [Deltaproteobacteria bacterium]
MRKRHFVLAVFLLVVFLSANCLAAETYKIGVLAKRGPVKALEMWKATADYLTSAIEGKAFEVVPLDFDEVNAAIEKGKVDFFLVNSSMFVTAKVNYGAVEIATMVNSRQGQPLKSFGGVIIASADNDAVRSLEDLKGKTFMAVQESSFGGWQMAYKEMLDAGIDPLKDLAKLEFGGKHDNVVLAVQNGVVVAGTVRTDTLERMAAEGLIEMDEFRIIEKKDHKDFPFVCSTALYPEWPLARTAKTPDGVAQEVVEALKKLTPEQEAAKNAKIVGWVDSLDYGPVEALQRTLKIGAFEGKMEVAEAN